MRKVQPIRGKQGGDGLTDRERAFVLERRKDPAAPGADIAERAGYKGPRKVLAERARVLMKKQIIATAVHMPEVVREGPVTDVDLKADIRVRLLAILRSPKTSDADKIKAADKLLATIPGGYVPVQVDMKSKLTIESLVRSMGGAPDEQTDPDAPVLQLAGGA